MHDQPEPEQQVFLAEVEAVLRARIPKTAGAAVPAVLAERGWHTPEWPARWGGAALSPQQAFLLDRALTEAEVPRPDPDTMNRVGRFLTAFASARQCERWLPALAAGREAWVLHGSLQGAEPIRMVTRDGGSLGLPGSTLAQGACTADQMLVLAGDQTTGEMALVAVTLDAAAVTPGLPLDPDLIELSGLTVEQVGPACPVDVLQARLADVDVECARLGRCRTASLRRMVVALRSTAAPDEAIAHRLRALEVNLLGLEVMELRAFFPARDRGGSCVPDAALLAAVAIRAAELGTALAGIAVEALGYHALPAPDPHRQHNELPRLVADGSPPGPDAIGALLRYVGGLDTVEVRDRLAHLTGTGSDEG